MNENAQELCDLILKLSLETRISGIPTTIALHSDWSVRALSLVPAAKFGDEDELHEFFVSFKDLCDNAKAVLSETATEAQRKSLPIIRGALIQTIGHHNT